MRAVKSVVIDPDKQVIITFLDGSTEILFPNVVEFDGEVPVRDVQVNDTSIVTDGVANVPVASPDSLGVVRVSTEYGTGMYGGRIFVACATDSQIKASRGFYRPVAPDKQHASAFYGLAKAAGDTTQSASSNAVGTYTDEAKSAIQTMLGVSSIIGIVEGATASTAYSVGDLFLHDGVLYKATTAFASGDAIVPGTNCEQTTIINILKGE